MKRVLRFQILQAVRFLATLAGVCLLLAAVSLLLVVLPGPLPAGLAWIESILFGVHCAAGQILALALSMGAWSWGTIVLSQCISLGGTRRHWFLTQQGCFAVTVLVGRILVVALAAVGDCMGLRYLGERNWEFVRVLGTPGLWPWTMISLTGMVLACLGGVQMSRSAVRGYLIFCGALAAQGIALMVLGFGALLAETEGADLATGIGIGCVPVLLLGEALLWASVRKYCVR